MKKILSLAVITLKGGLRDKTLTGIGILSILFMFSTPLFASFSPRQPTAVAVDFTLSILSLTGLLLTLFTGVSMLAGDIDKKSIYTVISQPISKEQYIAGKYLGLILLIFIAVLLMAIISIPGIFVSQEMNKLNSELYWGKFSLCVFLTYIKLCIMAASIFLFSTIATNTFLPFSVGISFYFISESIENVKRYIEGYGMDATHTIVKKMAKFIYYAFPNFSAFNLKKEAIYNLPVNLSDITNIVFYGFFYIVILLLLSIIIFNRREFT